MGLGAWSTIAPLGFATAVTLCTQSDAVPQCLQHFSNVVAVYAELMLSGRMLHSLRRRLSMCILHYVWSFIWSSFSRIHSDGWLLPTRRAGGLFTDVVFCVFAAWLRVRSRHRVKALGLSQIATQQPSFRRVVAGQIAPSRTHTWRRGRSGRQHQPRSLSDVILSATSSNGKKEHATV